MRCRQPCGHLHIGDEKNSKPNGYKVTQNIHWISPLAHRRRKEQQTQCLQSPAKHSLDLKIDITRITIHHSKNAQKQQHGTNSETRFHITISCMMHLILQVTSSYITIIINGLFVLPKT